MESIVFFGKGGIGKSTIAANVTALMAAGGSKVLHIGCDPKMDSALTLMRGRIRPFSDNPGSSGRSNLRESIQPSAIKGVYCIEAGGPNPGMGCAGAGIGAMLDEMKAGAILEKDGYDAAIFDVLGDVVCGGFAAPLRRGFSRKVVIVTSEESLSLYAANRLITMVNNYARNGVYLAGLAVNARNAEGAAFAEAFARAVNTRVLGVILHDTVVAKAERAKRPAALAYPGSDFTLRIVRLSAAIRAAAPPAAPPRALTDAEFFSFTEGAHVPGKAFSAAPAAPPPAAGKTVAREGRPLRSVFTSAGFKVAGIEDGQIMCDWASSAGARRIVIAPAASARGGMLRFSDWTSCFHPSAGLVTGRLYDELRTAVARLSQFSFGEMLAVFTGTKDFYGGIASSTRTENEDQSSTGAPKRPHMAFGQWQRFIFPGGALQACVPPGSMMVEHGDMECRFSGCDGGNMGLFSGRDRLNSSGTRGPILPRGTAQIANTDFNGTDAVLGDDAKVLASLYGAAQNAGRGGLVEFYVGCSAMLLAGDVSSHAEKVERETDVKVVLENYNSFGEHAPAKAAVRADFMAARLRRGGPEKTCDVHLVTDGLMGEKIAGVLKDAGISMAGPGEDFYAAARSALVQVLSHPDTVLQPAFDKAGMKWILPPAPYGFSGTDAWLAAIAGALGRKKIKAGPSPAQKKEAAGLWRRARAYSAGFVLEAGELRLLAGEGALKMRPVLALLAEAGFRLKLFLKGDGPSKASAADLKELKARVPAGVFSVKYFRTMEELNVLLRSDSALKLVYSDVRRDPRVAAAGKNSFSAGLLEPGYGGAVESWRRLLELCAWDFNEQYLSTP
ncbi:MAG: nitrogenase component 1 [Elusimicrobiota bacterium]